MSAFLLIKGSDCTDAPCRLQARLKLEDERQALAAFVRKFDALGLGAGLPMAVPSKLNPPMPQPGGAAAVFAQRQRSRMQSMDPEPTMAPVAETDSPMRLPAIEPSLLEEEWDAVEDVSFGDDRPFFPSPTKGRKASHSPTRGVLGAKENMPV